jgi:hypothetical protein
MRVMASVQTLIVGATNEMLPANPDLPGEMVLVVRIGEKAVGPVVK